MLRQSPGPWANSLFPASLHSPLCQGLWGRERLGGWARRLPSPAGEAGLGATRTGLHPWGEGASPYCSQESRQPLPGELHGQGAQGPDRLPNSRGDRGLWMTSRAFPTHESPASRSLTPWAPLEGGKAACRAGGQGWAWLPNGAGRGGEGRPGCCRWCAGRGGTPAPLRALGTTSPPLGASSRIFLFYSSWGLWLWLHHGEGLRPCLSVSPPPCLSTGVNQPR